MKPRKKFMADIFMQDLKKGHALPFRAENERIAHFGKGFSNLLHMAGTPLYDISCNQAMSNH